MSLLVVIIFVEYTKMNETRIALVKRKVILVALSRVGLVHYNIAVIDVLNLVLM